MIGSRIQSPPTAVYLLPAFGPSCALSGYAVVKDVDWLARKSLPPKLSNVLYKQKGGPAEWSALSVKVI